MLAQIRDSLSAVHPQFPWLVLFMAIWLAQWATRRWAPKVWTIAFSWVPSDTPDLARRILQGLPSVLMGAAIPAMASGGDVNQAMKGALFGALAPLWHHMFKALPGPYRGRLSTPPPPPNPAEPGA